MKIRQGIQLLAGLFLLVGLVFIVDAKSFAAIVSSLGFTGIVVILIFHVFFQVLFSSMNVFLVARALGKNSSYLSIFRPYFAAWSVGKFLPGGTGELSIIYALKKKMPVEDAVFITFFDKVLTVVTFILISSLGIWFFFPLDISLLLLAIFVVIILIMLTLFLSNDVRKMIKKYILRRHSSKFRGFSRNFRYLLREKKKFILSNITLTAVKSLFAALTPYILFRLLDIPLGLLEILFINTALVLIGMIPITTGGIGTKEAAAIYLYSLLGVVPAAALGVYASLRIVLVIVAGVILLMFIALRRKSARGTL